MHGPVDQSGVEVKDLFGAMWDTETWVQVSALSPFFPQFLLALALGCNWLEVCVCFEYRNHICLSLIGALPLAIDLFLALLSSNLIPDLLGHRRLVIGVLPITESLQSLLLKGLLVHRSVAAQLTIQWGSTEFSPVTYTVAKLVKPIGDLVSFLSREIFLRLILSLDNKWLTTARVMAGLVRWIVSHVLSMKLSRYAASVAASLAFWWVTALDDLPFSWFWISLV